MENLNTNQNPVNVMPQMPEETPKPSSIGPLIGIIIVILVIVLGGLYFWGQRVEKNADESMATKEGAMSEGSDTADTSIELLETQGSSDEITDIEKDLDSTDLENLDQELELIESELDTIDL